MTIIIHLTTPAGKPAWMDAPFVPFVGTVHYYENETVSPPREGWQVVAPKKLSLALLKEAVFMVDEQEALDKLEALGCEVQRRKTDRLVPR